MLDKCDNCLPINENCIFFISNNIVNLCDCDWNVKKSWQSNYCDASFCEPIANVAKLVNGKVYISSIYLLYEFRFNLLYLVAYSYNFTVNNVNDELFIQDYCER